MSGNIVALIGTKRAVLINLNIEQGTDLEFPITLQDAQGVTESANGWTAKLQVRKYVEADEVLWEMTTENGRISTTDGKVTLIFANADFTGVTWRAGYYDLEIVSPGSKRERLMEGQFMIDPEVTR